MAGKDIEYVDVLFFFCEPTYVLLHCMQKVGKGCLLIDPE
jgi:hypothetical protein